MDNHRFKIIVAGRRWGKTVLGLIAVLGGHGDQRQRKGALQGGKIWWIAPTYGIASYIWQELKQALKELQDAEGYDKREDERTIRLPGGGSVTVKSADNPDSLRGVGLDGICFDEAAYMDEETWTMALRPALADRQGWAIFISTPKMDDVDKKKGIEWFKRLYLEAENNPTWMRWQRPSMDNKTIPDAEFEELKKMPDIAYRQEILAEFVDIGEGLFKPDWFRYFWLDATNYYLVTPEGTLAVPIKSCKIVITADLAAKAKETNDYTAVEVWAFTPGQQKMILLDVQRGRYTENQTKKLFLDAWQKWKPETTDGYIAIEEKMTGYTYIQALRDGTTMKDELTGKVTILPKMRIVSLLTKGEDKFTRAITIADHMKAGRVFFPDVNKVHVPWYPEFRRELLAFPSKQVHDDQVDAAAYAGIELGKPSMFSMGKLPLMIRSGVRR